MDKQPLDKCSPEHGDQDIAPVRAIASSAETGASSTTNQEQVSDQGSTSEVTCGSQAAAGAAAQTTKDGRSPSSHASCQAEEDVRIRTTAEEAEELIRLQRDPLVAVPTVTKQAETMSASLPAHLKVSTTEKPPPLDYKVPSFLQHRKKPAAK
mmetsp:Transcript_2230/g.3137  ORF Transcript_2230/g.3137 Transcript_2230/m.3137 type:complete len:153 (-) Transcript_2230:55-513(-)